MPIDITRAPHGEIGLRALIDEIAGVDDALVERHFLEVKSDVDVASKEGLAKIAKFILGAANRMPDRAAAAFEGHALMLLGIGADGVSGVRRFEVKDLVDGVLPHLSAEGPRWEFYRVQVDDRDILVIDVAPPRWGDPLFPCHKEGHALLNGTVYVRTDGATRPATGDEVVQLQTRAARGRKVAVGDGDLVVEVVGAVRPRTCRLALMEEYIRWMRDKLGDRAAREMIAARDKPSTPSTRSPGRWTLGDDIFASMQPMKSIRLGSAGVNRLNPDVFLASLDSWSDKVRAAWESILDEAAAVSWTAVEVSIRNDASTYLQGAQLVIDLPGPVRALESRKEIDLDDVLPDLPREYERSASYGLGHMPAVLTRPYLPSHAPRQQTVHVERLQGGPGVRVTVDFGDVRPGSTHIARERRFVLMTEPGDSAALDATWTLTAREHDGIFQGAFSVPVAPPGDVEDALRAALNET